MRVLVIDDILAEINAASAAVKAAGHEPVICIGPWGMTLEESEVPVGIKQAISSAKLPILSAWKAVEEFVTASLAGEQVGILTDLMFPTSLSSGRQPNGMLVAAHAVAHKVPVVICTDADGNHHAGPCGAIRDGYQVTRRVFGFIENKDWVAAMQELERRSLSKE